MSERNQYLSHEDLLCDAEGEGFGIAANARIQTSFRAEISAISQAVLPDAFIKSYEAKLEEVFGTEIAGRKYSTEPIDDESIMRLETDGITICDFGLNKILQES